MSPEEGDPHIQFLEGNAERLPIEDATYDAYTIAFGIRYALENTAIFTQPLETARTSKPLSTMLTVS